MLGSESLFQNIQLEVLVTNLLVPDAVPARRLALLSHRLSEPGEECMTLVSCVIIGSRSERYKVTMMPSNAPC